VLALGAACVPGGLAPTFTPMVLPSATAVSVATVSPTATASRTPTATPTPLSTFAPTMDPAAVATIAASGQSLAVAQGVDPLCLRWEDTDGDGAREWLGVYVRGGDQPELGAFILDGDEWFELVPLAEEKYGLGRYPVCDVETRDVNSDGTVEILIWGHAGEAVGLLHIYAWNGSGYGLVGTFEGPASVRMEDRDGDLLDEIVVRYPHRAGRAWEAVYTWDGYHYGWTWERYAWYYLDRPHAYASNTPEDAVISYYLALNDRDMSEAYGLLSAGTRAAAPYEAWVSDFAAVLAIEVGAVGEQSSDDHTVGCQVRTYESVDGRVFAVLRDVQWSLVKAQGGWRLQSQTALELNRREAVYYP